MESQIILISNSAFIELLRNEIGHSVQTEMRNHFDCNIQNTPRYLTIKQASIFLNLSVSTVRKKARERILPAFKSNRKWSFLKSDLETYMSQCRRKTNSEIHADAKSLINK